MNLDEIIKEADAHTFGRIVRERRELMGKTVRGFAKELDITPAYLSDIEKGNRYAPKAKLEDMARLLDVPEDQKQSFMDLASLTRGEFDDIQPYIGQNHMARVALRKAEKLNITDEKWEEIIRMMD